MLSVADFARSTPLKLLPFGGRSCGARAVARAPRLLLCRDADAVLVWRLPAAAAAAELAAAAAANANGAAGAAERARGGGGGALAPPRGAAAAEAEADAAPPLRRVPLADWPLSRVR